MEENNVQTTTVVTPKEGSNFGWGVLGFFIPLAGFILFLVWLKDKKKAAKAAGLGALIGFILGLILSTLTVYFYFNGFFDSNLESKNVKISKSTENKDKFTISDYEYVFDFSKTYISARISNYNAIDSNGKKLFAIQETNMDTTSGFIHDYKIVMKNGKEIPFAEYYSGIDPYEQYHFYYYKDVIMFNVKNNNTGYYFYDLKNNKLVKVFDDEDEDNGLLKITDIVIDDNGSITFKATYNEDTVKSLDEKYIYKKLINDEYKTLEDLSNEINALKTKAFVTSKEITYEYKSGYYSKKPTVKKQTIIDLYNEKYKPEPTPTPEPTGCTGKVENGKSKYEYKLKYYGDYDSCDSISFNLNSDFRVKLDTTNYPNPLGVYVNDTFVTGVLSGVAENNLTMYIAGKTLVTREFSTDQGAPVYLVKTNGEVYSVSNGAILYKLEDGMLTKEVKVDDSGNLVITGTRHDNTKGEYMGTEYLDQVAMCDTSFEMLVKTHNVPSDYDFMTDYTYKLNDDGLFNLEYSSKKSNQTWSNFYKKKCTKLQ